MGKLDIAIDANHGGKNWKLEVTWEGDDVAIRSVINDVEDLTAHARGKTPKHVTHEVLRSLRYLENEAAVRSI
jgi:hypothetical protein